MDTVLFLFLGIAAFGSLVALIVKGGSDDMVDDYWRDM